VANAIEIVIKAINQAGSVFDDVAKDIGDVDEAAKTAGQGMQEFGKSATATGAKMSAGLSLPMAGAAAVVVSSTNSINAGLANVASLGVSNVEKYRDEIQQMSVDTGQSTTDLTDGLYQVVSAFGETGESAQILGIAAQAGAAGLATTEEAINLLSATTKGYGDTSAEAVQKAADLAFQTVKLGQTTFPELASAMGRVVPLAATLGVSQEELNAQFATLTGVTGSAAEVGTQLRATYQSILKPTTQMGGALASVARQLDEQGKLVENEFVDSWRRANERLIETHGEIGVLTQELTALEESGQGSSEAAGQIQEKIEALSDDLPDLQKSVEETGQALGQSIIDSVGYSEALGMITEEAGGNTKQLGDMFGSVEALNAVLALGGPQAETYQQKLAEMNDVTGASASAFEAQTQGVNAAAFQMQQLQLQLQVVSQDLGQALIPALTQALTAITPLIERISEWAASFQNLSPQMQTALVAVGAIVAALGPMLTMIGLISSGIGAILPVLAALGTALGALLSPVGLVVAAIGGLAAIMFDLGGANEKVAETLRNWGMEGAAEAVKGLHEWTQKVVDTIADLFSGEKTFADIFEVDTPDWITKLLKWSWPEIDEIDWIVNLTGWSWPKLDEVGWVVKLTGWSWPTISQPTWIQKLLGWSWPKFPSRPGWLGGDRGNDAGNATGSSYWRGGLTWVGETGPELVAVPRGSQIFPAGESRRMAADGMNGINITINANVASDVDVASLARRVAQEIQRRGR